MSDSKKHWEDVPLLDKSEHSSIEASFQVQVSKKETKNINNKWKKVRDPESGIKKYFSDSGLSSILTVLVNNTSKPLSIQKFSSRFNACFFVCGFLKKIWDSFLTVRLVVCVTKHQHCRNTVDFEKKTDGQCHKLVSWEILIFHPICKCDEFKKGNLKKKLMSEFNTSYNKQ